ncbi:MAG: hypothetical protein V4463_25090 [Pseudomonadota bacterium]
MSANVGTIQARERAFPAQHRWDRNAIAVLAALVWLGIVMGFGGDMIEHAKTNAPPYLFIVHIHAAAFVGWLVLFTVQIGLIRHKRWLTHKRLGMGMAVLAVAMVILGPLAEYLVDVSRLGTPRADPAFFAIALTAMLAFTGLVGAALLMRRDASTHKRLMLLGTFYISSAGFARWEGAWLGPIFGEGPLGLAMVLYFGSTLLMLALGAYDLATRRRLHPAYVAGLAWALAIEAFSVWLYHQSAWLAWCKAVMAA